MAISNRIYSDIGHYQIGIAQNPIPQNPIPKIVAVYLNNAQIWSLGVGAVMLMFFRRVGWGRVMERACR